MKKHNFYAGPAILPEIVKRQAAEAALEYQDIGLSLMEISHRSTPFIEIIEQAEANVRALFSLSDEFGVLFLTGGASSQFYMTAMNLADQNDAVGFVDTGTWSSKSIKEARLLTEVKILSSSKDRNYCYIPKDFDIPSNLKYLHLTSNNTIYGTQFKTWPQSDCPIVCDMSSDIFSKPIPIDKFGLIYAGAQKNAGSAGMTIVIVKKDLLGKINRSVPTMLDYRTHVKSQSMYNTPPVFSIYVTKLTLDWIISRGGVEGMQVHNAAKADLLYSEIDRNPLFIPTVDPDDRSLMNVTFLLTDENLTEHFNALCESAGIIGLKGHRSVGGYRASMYNALELESVSVLVEGMETLENKFG